jgi:hypothetical protein
VIADQVDILQRSTHQIGREAKGNQVIKALTPALLRDFNTVTVHEVAAVTNLEE